VIASRSYAYKKKSEWGRLWDLHARQCGEKNADKLVTTRIYPMERLGRKWKCAQDSDDSDRRAVQAGTCILMIIYGLEHRDISIPL
jgi:hypothetical protein